MESCVEHHVTSNTMSLVSLVSFVLITPIQIVVLTASWKQLNCWVIKTNCIRSRFSATWVSVLICVTIGALEQILTAHLRWTTVEGLSTSKWPPCCHIPIFCWSYISDCYELSRAMENVILLGIIPGPRREYLRPFVKEMLQCTILVLWWL